MGAPMGVKNIHVEAENGKLENLQIKDLRDPSHDEYKAGPQDLQKHVDRAASQIGLLEYNDKIYQDILAFDQKSNKLSFLQHMHQLAGNAKGVMKYRMQHGKSSFERYKDHEYERLDTLNVTVLFQIDGKIYWAKNGCARIEFLDAVNQLVQGVENPTVLEAGCGAGLNMYMLNCSNPNLEISGFEYTNARLASAIISLWNSSMRNNLFLADICNMRLDDNSYDVVYTGHVMEQLGQERAEQAIKEAWRVCRRGIVIREPSIHGANAYEKWRMRTLGYCEDLLTVANKLPGAEVLSHQQVKVRPYPATSYQLVVRKKQ